VRDPSHDTCYRCGLASKSDIVVLDTKCSADRDVYEQEPRAFSRCPSGERVVVRWTLAMAVSAMLHVAVPAALIARALDEELPEPFVRGTICVFPASPFDPRELLLGSTDAEVRGIFNDPSDPEQRKGATCVRYKYESGSVITLFFRNGVVEGVGLGPGSLPNACLGQAVAVITLPKAG
jgi:hypothetical protein